MREQGTNCTAVRPLFLYRLLLKPRFFAVLSIDSSVPGGEILIDDYSDLQDAEQMAAVAARFAD